MVSLRNATWMVFLLAAVSVICGCSGGSGGGANTAVGQIAFCSNRGGGAFQIYLMDIDGGNQRAVTTDLSATEWSPQVSLSKVRNDGHRWIAFDAPVGANNHIFIVRDDGGKKIQVTTGDYFHTSPTWSPNGNSIAFVRWANDIDPLDRIYRATVSNPTSEANDPVAGDAQVLVADAAASTYNPCWKDETTIAYTSIEDGGFDNIFSYDVIDEVATQVTGFRDPSVQNFAINGLSYRNGQFVFGYYDASFETANFNGQIYLFTENDETDPASPDQPLANDPGNDYDDGMPCWSSDGARIIFFSDRNSEYTNIFSMSPTGESVVKLTSSGDNAMPSARSLKRR